MQPQAYVPPSGSWAHYRFPSRKKKRPPRAEPRSMTGMIRRRREERAVVPPIPTPGSARPVTGTRPGRARGGEGALVPLVSAMAPHGRVDIPALRGELATRPERPVRMPYYARELMDPATRAMNEQYRLFHQQEREQRVAEGRAPRLRGTIGGPGTPLLEFSPEQTRIARGQPVPATGEQIQSQIGLMGAGQMNVRAVKEALAQQSLVRGQRAYEYALGRFTPAETEDPTLIDPQGSRVGQFEAAEQELRQAQERFTTAQAGMTLPDWQLEQSKRDVLGSMRPTTMPTPEQARLFTTPATGWPEPQMTAMGTFTPTGAMPATSTGIAAQQARFGLAPPTPAPPIPQAGAMAGAAGAPPMPTAPPAPTAYWNPQFEAQLAELEKGRQIFTERPDWGRMLQEQQWRYGEETRAAAGSMQAAQPVITTLRGIASQFGVTLDAASLPGEMQRALANRASGTDAVIRAEFDQLTPDGTGYLYPEPLRRAVSQGLASIPAGTAPTGGAAGGLPISPRQAPAMPAAPASPEPIIIGALRAHDWGVFPSKEDAARAVVSSSHFQNWLRSELERGAGMDRPALKKMIGDRVRNIVRANIEDVAPGGWLTRTAKAEPWQGWADGVADEVRDEVLKVMDQMIAGTIPGSTEAAVR